MLDLAHTYDTFVIDDPDAPQASTADEDEHMRHVQVMGVWHRRTPDLRTTACGIPYHSQFCPTREAKLEDAEHMCSGPEGCFTNHEVRKAVEADAKEQAE